MIHIYYSVILLGVMGVFTIVGSAVCALPLMDSALWFTRYRSSLAHKLLIGQVVLILYYYVRSITVQVLPHGISSVELWILAVASLLYCLLQGRHGFTKQGLSEVWRHYASMYVLIPVLFMTFFCLTELPREVMLSSDPDRHAFWAHLLSQSKGIPWGSNRFEYPAGFAVLNVLYMHFSGLGAPTIVSIQPLIQLLIAFLILIEVAIRQINPDGDQIARIAHPLMLMFILAMLLVFFPYSFQHGRYYHEGTGRLSIISFLSIIFSFWIAAGLGRFRISSPTPFAGLVLVLRAILLTLVLFNPASFMIPALLTEAILLFRLPSASKRKGLLIFFSMSLLYTGLFIDPYWHHVPTAGQGEYVGHAFTFGSLDASSYAAHMSQTLHHMFHAIAEWKWFHTDMFRSWGSQYIVMVCAAFLIGCQKPYLLAPLGLAFCVFIIGSVLVGLFQVTSSGLLGELLIQYTLDNAQQFFYLTLLLVFMTTCFHLALRRHCIALVAALAVAFLPALADGNTVHPFSNRRGAIPSPMGDPTPNDRLMIKTIKQFGIKQRSQTQSPLAKILIMNKYLYLANSEWLFPLGGARSLVYQSPFPLAFYYGTGIGPLASSTKQYLRHVRDCLDIPWLVGHGIKYIYMPEGTRIHHIANPTLSGCPVRLLFREGDSRFYEIRGDVILANTNSSSYHVTRRPITLQWEPLHNIEIEHGLRGLVTRSTGADPYMGTIIPDHARGSFRSLYLSVELDMPTTIQWYYDFGKGFTEEASCKLRLHPGLSEVLINIPPSLQYLRIDPDCELTIRGAVLTTPQEAADAVRAALRRKHASGLDDGSRH